MNPCCCTSFLHEPHFFVRAARHPRKRAGSRGGPERGIPPQSRGRNAGITKEAKTSGIFTCIASADALLRDSNERLGKEFLW